MSVFLLVPSVQLGFLVWNANNDHFNVVLVHWSDLEPLGLVVDPVADVHHFRCDVRALDLA